MIGQCGFSTPTVTLKELGPGPSQCTRLVSMVAWSSEDAVLSAIPL